MNLSSKEKQKLKELENMLEDDLKSLKEIDAASKKRKSDDMKEMIRYYSGMTEKEKDRLTNLYNFALQILVICIAVLGFLFTFSEKLPFTVFLMVIAVLFIQSLASIIMIYLHEKQSNFNYPFLPPNPPSKFGNKWKWFYYGNDYIRQINTNAFRHRKSVTNAFIPYLQGLRDYVKGYKDENGDTEICSNIQQAYLLQVHNYFKNKFFLHLIKIRLWSVHGSVILAVIILIMRILFPDIMNNVRLFMLPLKQKTGIE